MKKEKEMLEKYNETFSTGWIYGYRPEGYWQGTGMYPREALKINKMDPSIYVLIANVYYMNNQIERSIYSYRAAVNLRPENDEYKLVFIQVLEDFLAEHRKEDIVANF